MKKINPLLLASTAFPLMALLSGASAFGPDGRTPALVVAQAAPNEAPGRVRSQEEEPGSKRDEKRVRRGQEQSGEAAQGERRPDARAQDGKQEGKEAPRPRRGEAAKEDSDTARPGREPAQPQRPSAPAATAPSAQPTRPAQTPEKAPQQPAAPTPQRAQETSPPRSAEPPAPVRRATPAGETAQPAQEPQPPARAPGAAPRTAPALPAAQEPATRQQPTAPAPQRTQETPPTRSAEPPAPARRAAPTGETARPSQEQQPTAPAPQRAQETPPRRVPPTGEAARSQQEQQPAAPAPGAAQRTAPAQPSTQDATQPPRQRPDAPRAIETAPARPTAPQPTQPTARPERQEPLRPQQPAVAPQTAPTPQLQQSAPTPQMAPAPLPSRPAEIRRQPEFGGQAPADLREGSIEDLRSLRRQRVEEGGRRVIIEEPGDRTIIRENGRVIIRHDETERFRQSYRGADVRVDRRGDSEVTVVRRPDGVEIVTVRDQDGHLIRRMRREPAGRETVLIDNRIRERPRGYFVDEVIDLPPPQVRIPRQKYVVEVERASQADLYEAFTAPPIERVQRAYTLDEIRQSQSLRERVRRVDLDTVTFEFGSWTLPGDQIGAMTGVATAIQQALADNPDEIFLIEGHTDAVGTEEDNLTLSDRRAETVARILTDRFRIPAENLTTQGYGEQYLKINTQEPERQNRRVTIRRITPLLKGAER